MTSLHASVAMFVYYGKGNSGDTVAAFVAPTFVLSFQCDLNAYFDLREHVSVCLVGFFEN